MSGECTYEGCTVGETGRCALERDPNTCPNRAPPASGTDDTAVTGAAAESTEPPIGGAVLVRPSQAPRFPASTTLGSEVIQGMMLGQYVTVVGILGDPESGKTACLASLYLLVANAQLGGWSFSESKSLMAFEGIARGARTWNQGNPPEQMTVHTEMADDRQPGFLHLRLRRSADGRRVDLALPDLPGEWTKSLVRKSWSERLDFLKSADVIWLVVDGRSLLDRERRQGAITRLGQLAARIQSALGVSMPRLLLVVTHRDSGAVPAATLDRVHAELAKHSVVVEMMPVAPFSDDDGMKPGFGLEALIDATAGRHPPTPTFWPRSSDPQAERHFLAYRRINEP